jgi:hypothetical protein
VGQDELNYTLLPQWHNGESLVSGVLDRGSQEVTTRLIQNDDTVVKILCRVNFHRETRMLLRELFVSSDKSAGEKDLRAI